MSHRINKTDWDHLQNRYSPLYQTIHNGMARISAVVRDVDFSTNPYYIGLSVPEGREAFIFHRSLKLSEGDFDVDVVVSSGGFTGGTLATKSTLRAGADMSVQCNGYYGVTPSGSITVVDEDFLDSGTNTANKPLAGTTASDEVMVTFTGDVMIRITGYSVATATVGARILLWEDDT